MKIIKRILVTIIILSAIAGFFYTVLNYTEIVVISLGVIGCVGLACLIYSFVDEVIFND